jgi:hypothetical protein
LDFLRGTERKIRRERTQNEKKKNLMLNALQNKVINDRTIWYEHILIINKE